VDVFGEEEAYTQTRIVCFDDVLRSSYFCFDDVLRSSYFCSPESVLLKRFFGRATSNFGSSVEAR